MGPLLHLHPLWPVLRELDRRITCLAAGQALPPLAPPTGTQTTALIPPTLRVAPPEAVRLTLRGPPPIAPSPSLPPDIQVSLDWKRQQVISRWQRAVQVARAKQQAQLARLEAELWRQVQVALNNLAIQEAIGGPGAAEARRMREKIERNVEEKLAAARQQLEKKLADELASLQERRDAELARLEREALQAAHQRQVPVLELPGDQLRLLQKSLQLPWPQFPAYDVPDDGQRAMLKRLLADYRQAAEGQAAAFQAAQARQLRRLQKAAAALRRLIRQDVEAAARSQALLHGIVLRVPPLEEPAGPDLTAQCARWLADLWAQQ